VKTTVSPAKSTDHIELLSLANKYGCDSHKLRKLLWLLNAPVKLHLIIPIAANLKSILASIKQHLRILQGAVHIDDWEDVINFILSHQQEIETNLGKHSIPSEKKSSRHPLFGKTLSTHPVYSIIISAHEQPIHREKFRLLQAHVILAHAKLMGLKTSLNSYEGHSSNKPILEQYHSAANECCRLIRDLSLDKNTKKLLSLSDYRPLGQKLHFLTLSTQEIAKQVAPLRFKKYPPINKRITQTLGLYFDHIYVHHDSVRKRSLYSRQSKYRRLLNHDGITILSDAFAMFETTYLDDDEHISRIFEFTVNDDDIDQDLPIDELATGQENYLINLGNNYKRPFAAQYMFAQGEARRRIMNNQLLKGRWSTMTLWEVATIQKLCEDEFQLELNSPTPDQFKLRVIVLILVMMWTGSSMPVARNLRICQHEENQTESLTYILSSRQWKFPNNLVHRVNTPTQEQQNASYPRSNISYLDDIIGLGSFLKNIEYDASFGNNVYEKYSEADLKKGIHDFLKKLPFGHRGSESNISNFLFSLIINQLDHNVATACLITAATHKLSNALLHYSTLHSDYLSNVYRGAVTAALTAIKKEVSITTPVHSTASFAPNHTYIGSDLCPTTETIQAMVRSLFQNISSTLKIRDMHSLIEYHNNYTVYVILMMSYCLGLRAVHHAFITPDDIDYDSGFTIISDKDNEYGYHSRLILIPDMLLKQIKCYEDHREHMMTSIMLANKNFTETHESPYLFLLEDNYKINPLKPKEVMKFVEATLPLPLNANRRYLRSQFEQAKIPSEVINYFMGHWHLGEEPWSKHSSLSYSTYTERLKDEHTNILKKLGWKAKKSRIFI